MEMEMLRDPTFEHQLCRRLSPSCLTNETDWHESESSSQNEHTHFTRTRSIRFVNDAGSCIYWRNSSAIEQTFFGAPPRHFQQKITELQQHETTLPKQPSTKRPHTQLKSDNKDAQRMSDSNQESPSVTIPSPERPQTSEKQQTIPSNTEKNFSDILLIDNSKTYPGLNAEPTDDSPWSSVLVIWPPVEGVKRYEITIKGEGKEQPPIKTNTCKCVFEGLIPETKYCVKIVAIFNDKDPASWRCFPDVWCQTTYPLGRNKYSYMTAFADNEIIKDSPGPALIYRKTLRNEKFAVKRILKTTLEREVDILSKLNTHENVIHYKGTDEDNDFVYVHLELCEGSLEDMIKNKQLPTNKVEMMKQIVNGLYFLHKNSQVLHRDLKPSNILYKQDVMKISNFSISKNYEEGNSGTKPAKGTAGYMPLGVARKLKEGEKPKYSEKSDIFSLGVLFHYILTEGKNPFDSEEEFSQTRIVRKEEPNIPGDPEDSKEAYVWQRLVKKMLSHEPEERPSIEEVLAHPLFWSEDEKNNFIKQVSDLLPPARIEKKKKKKTETELLKSGEMERYVKKLQDNACCIFDIGKKKDKWWVEQINVDAYKTRAEKNVKGEKRSQIVNLIAHIRNLIVHDKGLSNHDILSNYEKWFPNLIVVTYDVVEGILKDDINDEKKESLKPFYSKKM